MNQRIIPILNEIASRLSTIDEVKKIVLFGSYAYGHPNDESDLDICLVVEDNTFDNLNYFTFLGEASILISRYLYEKKLEYDLVACTESDLKIPPNRLIKDVAAKGKLLYEKNVSISQQVPTIHKTIKRS